MARTGNPWDQRTDLGESATAYTAFLVFRDLGPGRNVRQAYRQATGKPAASQVPGHWSQWSKTYQWTRRAAAWDARDRAAEDKARADAVAAAARAAGSKWVRAREEQLERELEGGHVLWRQGMYLAKFPVVTETVAADEKSAVYMAADPKTLAAGARICVAAREIIWSAIDRGLGLETQGPAAAPARSVETVNEAERRVLELKAARRAALLTMPDSPPGKETP